MFLQRQDNQSFWNEWQQESSELNLLLMSLWMQLYFLAYTFEATTTFSKAWGKTAEQATQIMEG